MPRPDPRSIATAESRAAGGRARAAKIKAEKEAVAKRIEDAWVARLDKMGTRLDEIIASDDEANALRAILAGEDRLAGKPTARTEVTGDVNVTVDARARIVDLLARHHAGEGKRGDSE